jgi:origin recognition complex subunit 3
MLTANHVKDDEMWNTELHARFMHSLHELDWLGFIKHTKRKMDHVAKTVFELPE